MSMMEAGSGRAQFALSGLPFGSELFDTLYCLAPQDLIRLPGDDRRALTVATVLLAAAQEFVVNSLAPLFPFCRQPVSDQLALAAFACVAVGVERACAPQLPGRARFDAINGGLEIICGFAHHVGGIDYRRDLAQLAQRFDMARRSGDTDEPARLLRSALMETLVDAAHLPVHGTRISPLIRGAVEQLQQELIPLTAERLIACWPDGATDCDNILARLTKSGDA